MNRLQIELTELCNFDCNICYLDKRHSPLLNLDQLAEIAEIAVDYGFLKIELTGGEPTMHPNFGDAYKIFREKGYLLSIYSNGSTLSMEKIKVFGKTLPHLFEITVYGMCEDTYTRVVRRRGMFQRVKRNIQHLMGIDANLFLKFHLTKDTYHEAEEFKEFVERNNIQHSFNVQIIPKLNRNIEPLKRRLEPREIKKLEVDLNIKFSQRFWKPGECDAGKTLYITSQGLVRGCPVLSRGEMLLDRDTPGKTFQSMRIYFDEFHKRQKEKYCTGWIDLEGLNSVDNFVRSV